MFRSNPAPTGGIKQDRMITVPGKELPKAGVRVVVLSDDLFSDVPTDRSFDLVERITFMPEVHLDPFEISRYFADMAGPSQKIAYGLPSADMKSKSRRSSGRIAKAVR
jgi:hypothetical protein